MATRTRLMPATSPARASPTLPSPALPSAWSLPLGVGWVLRKHPAGCDTMLTPARWRAGRLLFSPARQDRLAGGDGSATGGSPLRVVGSGVRRVGCFRVGRGLSPLGPVSRIIPLTEVSGIEQEIKGHMSNRPGSARFSVSRDASTGRQHPRCSSVRPLPARASPLEPDQARRISAAGDRVARPCVRGSRTGSEGSETAAEGPLRWRLGSRRGRIGRGSRRAWARCQDVGRIGGGRPGRPRGRRGGWGHPRG